MNKKIKLALVYGSTREGRFCDVIIKWAAKQINTRTDFELDIIDPNEFNLPARTTKASHEGLNALKARMTNADAFIIAVPEYNHSFPAAIKSVIDSLYEPWQAKPIGIVSYGGISGGLRATEQLRLVFAELNAIVVRDTVSFANAWNLFDSNGELKDSARAEKSMTILLNQLHWWARALTDAKTKTPYGEVSV